MNRSGYKFEVGYTPDGDITIEVIAPNIIWDGFDILQPCYRQYGTPEGPGDEEAVEDDWQPLEGVALSAYYVDYKRKFTFGDVLMSGIDEQGEPKFNFFQMTYQPGLCTEPVYVKL